MTPIKRRNRVNYQFIRSLLW